MADATASNLTSTTTVQEPAREPGTPGTDRTLPFFVNSNNLMPGIYFARIFDGIQIIVLFYRLASIQKMSGHGME